jgi:phenylpyruvate tautomerase PptA (4-oxalocrotonate tautomerase family)
MPLLEIEIVGAVEASAGETLAQRLADATGRVLGSPPQATWVRVRTLRPEEYAENEGGPAGVMPVFVKVTKRSTPPGDTLQTEVRQLTEAIAKICGRPRENVHVAYEPAAAGRQAFGGTLVEGPGG